MLRKTNTSVKVACILILAVINSHFVQAQIAFKPPINMWDTWIFQDDGEYHLFYLHGLGGGNIGRAVSTDMIHWEVLPAIMNMAEEGDWDERGMVMTGNTEKHGNTYYMSYGSGRPGVKIGFLTSKDLVNWKRYSKNPVLLSKAPYQEDTEHWRDLSTVYDKDKKQWDGYLFGIHGQTNRPSIAHVASKNYLEWEYNEPLFISEPYTRFNDGFIFMEVPDVFKMGDKYYVIFSSVRSRKDFTSGRKDASGTWYLTGSSKDGPYIVPEEPLLLGYGHGRNDTYVGHTVMYKGQRLLYHHTWGDFGKVTLATPKLLHQNSDGTLELRFWKDLKKLEKKVLFEQEEIECRVKKENSREWKVIDGVTGQDMSITGKVKMTNTSQAGITWHIRGRKAQSIWFYPDEDMVTIGEAEYITSYYAQTINTSLFDDYSKKGLLDGEFDVRIMIRSHMVEVYINDQFIFATAMLNTPEDGGGVGYWNEEGELLIRNLKISELKPLE